MEITPPELVNGEFKYKSTYSDQSALAKPMVPGRYALLMLAVVKANAGSLPLTKMEKLAIDHTFGPLGAQEGAA